MIGENDIREKFKSSIETETADKVYLEETFYILSKKKSVFKVRLTSHGLCLSKEVDGHSKEQTIKLNDIIGSKCMRSKRKRAVNSCICSSLAASNQIKVVEENSGDLDENDISAYLYVYAYILKQSRRTNKREKTTITLRFRSFDKYEDNNREAQKWRMAIKCLVANEPINSPVPSDNRKMLILVNPRSGPGKARELFNNKVATILQEAEVPYELIMTKHADYARQFVRTKNIYSWSAIVAMGGDGVLFEVLNGLFERLDWQQAFSEIPIGILPAGSGNGLGKSLSYLYNEPYHRFNLVGPAMALVKKKCDMLDVVRIETRSKIMFSFLSLGWGLISDIDIESERLRIFGGQRFTMWALHRLVNLRTYKGTVSYVRIKDTSNLPKAKHPLTIPHSISQDGSLDSPDAEAFIDCDEGHDVFTSANIKKHQRVDSWYSVNSRRSAYYSSRGSEYHSVTSDNSEVRSPVHACMHGPASRLPALMSQLPSHWTNEHGDFVMVHIAYQSYIGEDFLFAPRSKLSDGVMWMLMVKAGITRAQLLTFLNGIDVGVHAESENEYVKFIPISAFRIVPEGNNGTLTVDGELVEYGPVQGEIFPNIVKLIVPDVE